MNKFELLCLLEAISNYAYDIHYTAKGRYFFSDHLFSERLSDIDVKDDFIETFYLGKSEEAPSSADIARKVADLTPEITENTQDNFKRLRDMIISALMGIENYDGTKGEEDLLGSVAHILQRHNGLLYRQLTYTPEEIRNDNEDWEDIVEEEDTTQTLENEKWITVHPNKENPDDYRRLKVEDGETSKEAVERKYGKDDKKADTDKKEPEKEDKNIEEYKSLKSAARKLMDDYNSSWDKASEEYKQGEKSYERRDAVEAKYELKSKKDAYNEAAKKAADFWKNHIEEKSKDILKKISEKSKEYDNLVKSFDNMENEYEKYLNDKKAMLEEVQEYSNKSYKGEISKEEYLEKWLDFRLFKDKEKDYLNKQVLKTAEFLRKDYNSGFKAVIGKSTVSDYEEKLNECIGGLWAKDTLHEQADKVAIKKARSGSRAAFRQGSTEIKVAPEDDYSVYAHEYTHYIENQNPEILANSLAFAKARTEGEKIKTLASLTGNRAYKGEYARKDKFKDAYCGKIYQSTISRRNLENMDYTNSDASEIMSMGIQYLLRNPKKFAEEDREYFNFVIANMRGEL